MVEHSRCPFLRQVLPKHAKPVGHLLVQKLPLISDSSLHTLSTQTCVAVQLEQTPPSPPVDASGIGIPPASAEFIPPPASLPPAGGTERHTLATHINPSGHAPLQALPSKARGGTEQVLSSRKTKATGKRQFTRIRRIYSDSDRKVQSPFQPLR